MSRINNSSRICPSPARRSTLTTAATTPAATTVIKSGVSNRRAINHQHSTDLSSSSSSMTTKKTITTATTATTPATTGTTNTRPFCRLQTSGERRASFAQQSRQTKIFEGRFSASAASHDDDEAETMLKSSTVSQTQKDNQHHRPQSRPPGSRSIFGVTLRAAASHTPRDKLSAHVATNDDDGRDKGDGVGDDDDDNNEKINRGGSTTSHLSRTSASLPARQQQFTTNASAACRIAKVEGRANAMDGDNNNRLSATSTPARVAKVTTAAASAATATSEAKTKHKYVERKVVVEKEIATTRCEGGAGHDNENLSVAAILTSSSSSSLGTTTTTTANEQKEKEREEEEENVVNGDKSTTSSVIDLVVANNVVTREYDHHVIAHNYDDDNGDDDDHVYGDDDDHDHDYDGGGGTVANLHRITACNSNQDHRHHQQQQHNKQKQPSNNNNNRNLKPILKRGSSKEQQQQQLQQQQVQLSPLRLVPQTEPQTPSESLPPANNANLLPPPILKKRDSVCEASVCLPPTLVSSATIAATTSSINNHNISNNLGAFGIANTHQSGSLVKPTSILKNPRPTRGSRSFDDRVIHSSNIDISSATNATPSNNLDIDAYNVKPILKKKSRSIEERVTLTSAVSSPNSITGGVEHMKSILKSSNDKLSSGSLSSHTPPLPPSQSSSASLSSSRQNSINANANLHDHSALHTSSSSSSPSKAILKGILKVSSNCGPNRSSSISSCEFDASTGEVAEENSISSRLPARGCLVHRIDSIDGVKLSSARSASISCDRDDRSAITDFVVVVAEASSRIARARSPITDAAIGSISIDSSDSASLSSRSSFSSADNEDEDDATNNDDRPNLSPSPPRTCSPPHTELLSHSHQSTTIPRVPVNASACLTDPSACYDTLVNNNNSANRISSSGDNRSSSDFIRIIADHRPMVAMKMAASGSVDQSPSPPSTSSSPSDLPADVCGMKSDLDYSSSSSNDDCSNSISSMNLAVFRRKHGSNETTKTTQTACRPKSCFVTSSELLNATKSTTGSGGGGDSASSIAQRLAMLKQNGEEGWKNRVRKSDVEREIQTNSTEVVRLRPKITSVEGNGGSATTTATTTSNANTASTAASIRGSVIANRLSSLLESQTQWRCRVNENDAKQFTVTSRQSSRQFTAAISTVTIDIEKSPDATTTTKNHNTNQTLNTATKSLSSSSSSSSSSSGIMDPASSGDKVVLRGTPKRLGLRGSTLNESALNSISSKLNSVLRPDRSLLSSPLTPIRRSNDTPSSSSPSSSSSSKFDLEPQSLLRLNSGDRKSTPHIVSSKPNPSPAPVYLPKPDDEESFGSFFAIDSGKLDSIIGTTISPTVAAVPSVAIAAEPHDFRSLQFFDAEQPARLLSNVKKSRIQTPKRRAASSHNPIKQLNKSCISVDSYTTAQPTQPAANVPNTPVTNGATKSQCGGSSSNNTANMALSALAGLASTEDFKSIASKLRNSSTPGSQAGNDTWRAYDLKNSLQSRMLILVKGRRHAQIRLIEPGWRSLCLADSFILVTKDSVFAFVGPLSNIIERTKCIEIAEEIRKRREMCYKRSPINELMLVDGHAESVRGDLFRKLRPMLRELDYLESDDSGEWDRWIASRETISSVDDDDDYYEESLICTNMIYDVTLNDAKSSVDLLPVEKYWGRSPRHQLLQPESVFVFDFGTEMYVWIGKSVSNVHRNRAVDAAKELWLKGYDYSEVDLSPFGVGATLKCEQRPDWAWFTRVNQNMEPALFKDKFFNWPAFTLTRSVKRKSQSNLRFGDTNSGNTPPQHHIVKKDLSRELNLFPVDVENEMLHKPIVEPNLVLEFVSLGRGPNDIIKDEDDLPVKIVSLEVQCFFIDDCGERVELEAADRNYLFTGESYYIRWKYRLTRISRCLKTGAESKHLEKHGGRDRLCYFVWQGMDACNTQRGATALNAIDKLREEGACQEIVENGKEFPAFLRIFEGNLVIMLGKRNQQQVSNNKQSRGYRMFVLKSLADEEMFLVELDCAAKNLRSRASFIFIETGDTESSTIYIWHGCKASPKMRRLTKQFLKNRLLENRSSEFGFTAADHRYETIEIDEGKESREFFNLFNTGSTGTADSSLRRSSRSCLQREIYFSLLDDNREYHFTPRLFQFTTSAERKFEAIELLPSYVPAPVPEDHQSARPIVIDYPFVQNDLYMRASTRPSFFLLDNHYEVYLWESKFPFFILGSASQSKKSKDEEVKEAPPQTPKKSSGPRMIDIESEILSEANLTTGSLAHIWLAERQCALETTLAYCHAKNASEPPKAYVISAGLEPPNFCGLFPTWIYHENVAQLHIEDGRRPGQQILVQEVLAQLRDIHSATYSYDELKRRPLPEGINVLCLESYLDDQEFEKLFGFNREEFYALPTWKQKNLKQDKELF